MLAFNSPSPFHLCMPGKKAIGLGITAERGVLQATDMLDYSFDKPVPVPALQALFRQTSWASHRSDSWVALIIANTPVQLGVWQADRLLGYARALTDGRFRALIDDVVVDEAQRGSGIGGEIMRRLVGHLTRVDEVFLLADDRNVSYYSRLGFVPSKAKCLYWPNS